MKLPGHNDPLETPEAQEFWDKVDTIFCEAAECPRISMVTIVAAAFQAASFGSVMAGATEADFLMLARQAWRQSTEQLAIMRAEIDATQGKAAKA